MRSFLWLLLLHLCAACSGIGTVNSHLAPSGAHITKERAHNAWQYPEIH